MNNKSTVISSIVISFLLIFTACTSANNINKLNGKWELISYGSGSNPAQASSDSNKTLLFENGKISGSAGCNSISGSYSVKEKQVTFEPIASTMMACPETIMQQESTVLSAFTGTADYVIENNTLTITNGDFVIVLNSIQ